MTLPGKQFALGLLFGLKIDPKIYSISQRGPASTRAIQSILEDIGKDARIYHLTPHMARHTFAKNSVNSGVSLEKVAMLLGHSSLDTTIIYTTPRICDLDRAVQLLGITFVQVAGKHEKPKKSQSLNSTKPDQMKQVVIKSRPFSRQ